MYNLIATEIANDEVERDLKELITQESLAEHFSLESATTTAELFQSFTYGVGKIFKKLLNVHEDAMSISPKEPTSALRALKGKTSTEIRDTLVYRVPKCTASYAAITKELSDQLRDLRDMDERLYRPLNRWAARTLNDEEYAAKAWIDRDVKFRDISKHKKELAKMFQEGKFRDESSEMTKFINAFGTIENFEKTWNEVETLGELLAEINLVRLKEIEARLVANTQKVVDAFEAGELEALHPGTRKMLARTFVNLADETEYLAAIVFYANNVIGQWNNTIERLAELYK